MAGEMEVAGPLKVGGGYGSTGATIEANGNFSTDGNLVAAGVKANTFINLASATATISAGVATATKSLMLLDTEGGASTDDLDTLNGGATGDVVYLRSSNDARDITLKHATGNLRLSGGADFTLSNVNKCVAFRYDGSVWRELSRTA
jgi:hypothetical protein